MNKGYSVYFDKETYKLIVDLSQDLAVSKSDAVRICIRKALDSSRNLI